LYSVAPAFGVIKLTQLVEVLCNILNILLPIRNVVSHPISWKSLLNLGPIQIIQSSHPCRQQQQNTNIFKSDRDYEKININALNAANMSLSIAGKLQPTPQPVLRFAVNGVRRTSETQPSTSIPLNTPHPHPSNMRNIPV
jgi:hypothetical protein